MGPTADDVVRILSVLLDRAKRALELVQLGDIDAAIVELERRRAAWLNLRAVDALVLRSAWSPEQSQRTADLTAALLRLDEQLDRAIGLAAARENVALVKTASARQRLSRYRSGESVGGRFEGSA
jgi:hypothetical protein